ncbi:MAG: glycosyltransferase family 2 protein [Oscillospiraceae bacterium]
MNRLAIVVPCYNEEDAFPITAKALTELLKELIEKGKIAPDSRIIFVDDGSKDKTWELIENEHNKNLFVNGVKLAGNAGHQNALIAGLFEAAKDFDLTVSVDADLQDDIRAVEQMVDKANGGADIVYGVRSDRSSDSAFKRATAQGFYKMMSALGAKTVYNHADFRLMSRRAVLALEEYGETEPFLRGIVPLIGYKTDKVYYQRAPRCAGESKYPLKKMLKFAFGAITSFSIKPISMVAALGIVIIFVSIIAALYSLISYFFGHTVQGWTSLMLSIWFLGGVQLFSLGLIGQYVGKTYIEAKKRPRFIIEKKI